MGLNLPIDVVPNTRSLTFRWKHKVSSPAGTREVQFEAALPGNVEAEVEQLVHLTKMLMVDNQRLVEQVELLTAQVDKQLHAPQVPSLKKAKG